MPDAVLRWLMSTFKARDTEHGSFMLANLPQYCPYRWVFQSFYLVGLTPCRRRFKMVSFIWVLEFEG